MTANTTKDNECLETKQHNRSCPKCGATCVGVIFEDVKEGYDASCEKEQDYYWERFGVVCSQCGWELQLRSANS